MFPRHRGNPRRGAATEKTLQELLQVTADAAEELGKAEFAALLREMEQDRALENLREFAHRMEEREYYKLVGGMAEEIVEDLVRQAQEPPPRATRRARTRVQRVRAGFVGCLGDAQDALPDRVREAIESSQQLAHLHGSLHVLAASDNRLIAERQTRSGLHIDRVVGQFAYAALEKDVIDTAWPRLEERFEELWPAEVEGEWE